MGRHPATPVELAEREGLASKEIKKDKGILKHVRHEAFAQALARGLSASAAYIEAGYTKNDGNASRLSRAEHVLRRVDELKQLAQKLQTRSLRGVMLSRDWVHEQLIEVVFMAKSQEKPDLAGANKALHLLGLDIGMFVERKEVGKPGEFDGLTIASKRERVIAIAQTLGLDRIAPAPKPVLVPATIEHEPSDDMPATIEHEPSDDNT